MHREKDLEKSTPQATTDLVLCCGSIDSNVSFHILIKTWSTPDPFLPPCWFFFQFQSVSIRVYVAINDSIILLQIGVIDMGRSSSKDPGVIVFGIATTVSSFQTLGQASFTKD